MKEAQKALRAGNYQRAADLFLLHGHEQEAIDTYLKGRHYEEAARILEKQDSWRPAAKYYLLAHNFSKAAQMNVKMNDFAKAAVCYEQAGDLARASEMHFRAGNFQAAAETAEKGGWPDKAAVAFEKAGETRKAADIHFDLMLRAGQPTSAVDPALDGQFAVIKKHANAAGRLYFQLGEYQKAAFCFDKAGSRAQAAAAYEASKQYLKAGELYAMEGEHRKACDMMEKCGKLKQASELAEKATDIEHAAELAEKAGQVSRAAALYARVEKYAKAAEIYFQALKTALQELAAVGGPHPTIETRVHTYGFECGTLFMRLRNFPKAAWCFEQAKQIKKAAECYTLARLPEKAGEMYFKLKEFEKAYESLKNAREIENKELYAEACYQTSRFQEAGDLFAAMDRPARAADAYEQAGDTARAAAIFEDLGKGPRAAELFVSLGKKDKAAELFEQNQDFPRAASLYSDIGAVEDALRCAQRTEDVFLIAGLLIRKGDLQQAIPLLQKVDRRSPEYMNACLLLGRLFSQLGIHQLAVQKFTEGIGGEKPSKTNLAAYYDLAAALVQTGETAKAQQIYNEMLSVQFDYRDVLEKVRNPGAVAEVRVPQQPEAGQIRSDSTQVLQLPQRAAGAPQAREIREYELLEVLSSEEITTVYRARHKLLKKERVIRVIRARGAGVEFSEQFVREARILSEVNHPNVIHLYEFGMLDDGQFFMVLESLQGESVRSRVIRSGKIPLKEALKIAREAALGLHAAHQKGIVHRDVSPDSLLLVSEAPDREGVRIIDFGIARFLPSETLEYTATSAFLGKAEYASPEQCGFLKQNERIDCRADIYSLAVTLFFMLTGTIPFSAGSPQDYLIKHLTQKPTSVRKLLADCPAELDHLIQQALSPRREKRQPSMEEFARAIDRIRI